MSSATIPETIGCNACAVTFAQVTAPPCRSAARVAIRWRRARDGTRRKALLAREKRYQLAILLFKNRTSAGTDSHAASTTAADSLITVSSSKIANGRPESTHDSQAFTWDTKQPNAPGFSRDEPQKSFG